MFSYPPFFFAAALAALGAEGSDTSNAISDDLPCIGSQFTSFDSICFSLSFFLLVFFVLFCLFLQLHLLLLQGSDSSNAISDDLPTADEPLWAASFF